MGDWVGTALVKQLEADLKYAVYSEDWKRKADAPFGFMDGCGVAAVISNVIYCVGVRDDQYVYNKTMAYDTSTDTWSTKAIMPTARYGAGLGVLSSQVYVIGGVDAFSSYVSTNESYDPGTNSWTTRASMSTSRGWIQIGAVGTTIVVAGGFTGSVTTNATASYTTANTWTSKTNMITARDTGVGVATSTDLYVIGGYPASGSDYTKNESFNLSGNSWTSRAAAPASCVQVAGALLNNTAFVMGGGGDGNSVLAYDTVGGAWTTKRPLTTTRSGALAATANSQIYLIGGNVGGSETQSKRTNVRLENTTAVTPHATLTSLTGWLATRFGT